MLEDIKSNITRLIALYEAERQRADGLAEKLAKAEEESGKYKEQINILNQKIDSLNLAAAFSGNTDKTAANERINKMIREIDRCIKLLEG